MSLLKVIKDHVVKRFSGRGYEPQELADLHEYFRIHGPITFHYQKKEGSIVAVSQNFQFGSIVTSGKDERELDKNIKDAILTSFDVPSAYAREAKIRKQAKETEGVYALA
ncbi:MAG: hypothetical protein G01um101438_894 [Parcubacteria group bacterium Gr01-1014_38]|nr:MAG: hypothetical protein G01um101438_894 [Parcubacteria group bacterium Gr01-1014_38]